MNRKITRQIKALQILRELARRHHSIKNAILGELGLSDSDFDSARKSCTKRSWTTWRSVDVVAGITGQNFTATAVTTPSDSNRRGKDGRD